MNSLTTSSNVLPFSNSSAISIISCAKIAFKIVFGPATDCEEPAARNSNLFPVNANGEVLFLSVLSFEKVGTTSTPVLNLSFSFSFVSSPVTIISTKLSNVFPKNIEMIAGGASLAPKR